MSTRRHDTQNHHCDLPDEPDDIIHTIIEGGIFVILRRRLKRMTMVNLHHPRCRAYINSLTLLRMEERRHLIRHYIMIHPFSMFNFYWKMFMVFVLFGTNFILPSIAAYFSPLTLNKAFAFSNVSFLLLIVLSFFTGYYDRSKNYVVLTAHKVAIHYITTYFIFDMFAIGAVLVWFLRKTDSSVRDPGHKYTTAWTTKRRLSWILPLFKFARYPYFLDGLKEMKLYYSINHYLFQAVVTFMNFIFFLLFTVTVIYVILEQFKEFSPRTHLECVKSSISMLLMVNHGYHTSDHLLDKIFPILFITSGFLIHLLILVFVMQIWFQYHSTEEKQISVYNSMGAFTRYNALPLRMRERIFLYLDFKYQKHFYKDSSIIRATSLSLRKEVLIKISKESTQLVDMFKRFPEKVMEKLRSHLVSVIYLPNDPIIRAGSQGKTMFFIKNGTVRVTTPVGKEICRLRDGAHFGEIALVANLPRVANVTAVTPCELYILSRMHFMEVLNQHPELLSELTTLATERIAGIQSLAGQAGVVADDLEEIEEFEHSRTQLY